MNILLENYSQNQNWSKIRKTWQENKNQCSIKEKKNITEGSKSINYVETNLG